MASLLLFHKVAAKQLQNARLSLLTFLVNLLLLSFLANMLLGLAFDPALHSLLARCSSALQGLKLVYVDSGVCTVVAGLSATFLALLGFFALEKEPAYSDQQKSTQNFEPTDDAGKEAYCDKSEIAAPGTASNYEPPATASAAPRQKSSKHTHRVSSKVVASKISAPSADVAKPSSLIANRSSLSSNHLEVVAGSEPRTAFHSVRRDLASPAPPSCDSAKSSILSTNHVEPALPRRFEPRMHTSARASSANLLASPAPSCDSTKTSILSTNHVEPALPRRSEPRMHTSARASSANLASPAPSCDTKNTSILSTNHVEPALPRRCEPRMHASARASSANLAQFALQLPAFDTSDNSMPTITRRAHSVPSSPNRLDLPHNFRRTVSSTHYYEYAKEAAYSTMTLYTASTIDALSKEDANKRFSDFASRKWASILRNESQRSNHRLG